MKNQGIIAVIWAFNYTSSMLPEEPFSGKQVLNENFRRYAAAREAMGSRRYRILDQR